MKLLVQYTPGLPVIKLIAADTGLEVAAVVVNTRLPPTIQDRVMDHVVAVMRGESGGADDDAARWSQKATDMLR